MRKSQSLKWMYKNPNDNYFPARYHFFPLDGTLEGHWCAACQMGGLGWMLGWVVGWVGEVEVRERWVWRGLSRDCVLEIWGVWIWFLEQEGTRGSPRVREGQVERAAEDQSKWVQGGFKCLRAERWEKTVRFPDEKIRSAKHLLGAFSS